MIKMLFKAILFVALASSAFAQSGNTQGHLSTMPRDQFAEYVIKGISMGFEYGALDTDAVVSIKDSFGVSQTASGSSNGSNNLGLSVNYGEVRRSGTGWLVGASLLNKLQSGDTGLKGEKSFFQLRPDLNAVFAGSSGFWGMVGGHLSVVSGGDIRDELSPGGIGLQVALGWTPARNFGGDIGYYVTHHRISDEYIDQFHQQTGYTIAYDDSYVLLKQLRARMTYYF